MGVNRHSNIDDVAKLAGVSSSTVSRVMNGSQAVRPETVRKVKEAAERLDYVPSNAARSLSLGRSHTVAFVAPDLSNPMFQLVLQGATSAAATAGYRLLVSDSLGDPSVEAALAIEARRRCDALILCSPRMPSRDLRRVLETTDPVVLINRAGEAGGSPVVAVDYAEGSRTLMHRLMRRGHTSFVYLAGPAHSISNELREQAMRAVVREHEGVELTVISAGARLEDGWAAVGPVLESRATAVLCYNDVVAIGLLGRLNEAGVTVPEDLSVAGYDDIPYARYITPSLTTVSVPKEDLGRHAWEEVQRILAGKPNQRVLTFAPRLVERGSTGPAPREAITVAPRDVPSAALAWHRDDDDTDIELSFAGGLLARYERRPVMPDVYSPRPYLHPIYTLGGTVVTDANAAPHQHQHGMSFVLDSVNGTNYWGSRTFVPAAGPTLLPNHGTQVSRTLTPSGPILEDRLQWRATDGTVQLEETRTISAAINESGDSWGLTWASEISPPKVPVVVLSPTQLGREDARYGGLFWRFPTAEGITLHTEDGEGGEAAHGSRSPWLALVHDASKGSWTVVLRQHGVPVPWHVRHHNYLAVSPSLVWDRPLLLEPGAVVRVGLTATILDRPLTRAEILGFSAYPGC